MPLPAGDLEQWEGPRGILAAIFRPPRRWRRGVRRQLA
jgi:hypothetical protein